MKRKSIDNVGNFVKGKMIFVSAKCSWLNIRQVDVLRLRGHGAESWFSEKCKS